MDKVNEEVEVFELDGWVLYRDRDMESNVCNLLRGVKLQELPQEAESEDSIKILLERIHTTEPQVIVCPRCGSEQTMKHGFQSGRQMYICNQCKRRFNTKGAPLNLQTSRDRIAASIAMYYRGMSLSKISQQLQDQYDETVNPSTVYRWVIRYTQEAINTLGQLKINTRSDVWIIDETVIKVGGQNLWFWDAIDDGSRFLLGSHFSKSRNMTDAMTVLSSALLRTRNAPKMVLSDGLRSYPDAIERTFGADSRHIITKPFTSDLNTNLIERFHGTIKDRTKIVRGFKTRETANLILQGFVVHYNFFRPHMTLRGKTPAEVAGIATSCKSWLDVVNGVRCV